MYICDMKKLLLISITLFALTACHKDIWDKLNDHEARIARLETLCNQFNTNISSLQSLVNAIDKRDYIKDVVPVTENGLTIGTPSASPDATPSRYITAKMGRTDRTGIRPLSA